MTAPELPPGLRERYAEPRLLGMGGMGAVYAAEDRELGRTVAVKVIRPLVSSSAESRFAREAESLAAIQHRNVVALYDFGTLPEGPYLVLEYVEGKSLTTAIGQGLSREQALEIFLACADGLAALHRAEVLHRDFKPDNVMIATDGRPVILDLGLAMDPSQTRLTRTGALVGTLHYLPPEVLRGGDAGPAADFYAWAVSFFLALEGRLPFSHPQLGLVAAGSELPRPVFHVVEPDDALARLLLHQILGPPEERLVDRPAIENFLDSEQGLASAAQDPLPETSVLGIPSLRFAVPTALVAAVLAGGYWMNPTPTPEASRPGASPALESPASRTISVALDRVSHLRDAMRPLLALHRTPAGRTVPILGTFREHRAAILPEYATLRRGEAHRRFFRVLGEWMQAARAAEAVAAEAPDPDALDAAARAAAPDADPGPWRVDPVLEEEVLPVLATLMTDYAIAVTYAETAAIRRNEILSILSASDPRDSTGVIPGVERASLRARIDGQDAAAAELVRFLRREKLTTSLPALCLEAALIGQPAPELGVSISSRIQGWAATARDARESYWTAAAALFALPWLEPGQPLPCSIKDRLIEIAEEQARRARPGVDPAARAGLDAALFHLLAEALSDCRESLDPRDLERLARHLATLKEYVPTHPEWVDVATSLTLQVATLMTLKLGDTPRWREFLEEIREAREAARARILDAGGRAPGS